MNFDMEVTPLDEFDFRYQYRIYWVEKSDEFYDFDPNEQLKVKRETLSMKESGEEQFEELEDDEMLAKVLMNNGKIVKQYCEHEDKQYKVGKYVNYIRYVAIKEGWLIA
jgi:hypothetical protein